MTLFANFGLQDVIDILIIGGLVYQAYFLLVGSRAWNVLRGILALSALWFLAGFFELRATKWLFDAIAPAAFLAVVVVFQPELRAVLERMGRGRKMRSATADPVQEIMTATRELATQRRGALIAIEGRTPLKEYADKGTPVGAPVTSALLQTIFASKGPLHDGAVIIREDVIANAGVIFPLSDKHEGWSVKHGTRHRAALGLAEVSDALVLVVSEERGTVSIAQNGALTPDIAPADLLRALKEAMS